MALHKSTKPVIYRPIEGAVVAKILLVDDDPEAASFVAEALQDDNHVTRVAATGEQALQILNSESVDALVTDLRMPSLDGIQLVRYVRAHSRMSEIPIIMMSGLAAHAELAGEIDAFLQKPFRAHRLTALLSELLRDRVA